MGVPNLPEVGTGDGVTPPTVAVGATEADGVGPGVAELVAGEMGAGPVVLVPASCPPSVPGSAVPLEQAASEPRRKPDQTVERRGNFMTGCI